MIKQYFLIVIGFLCGISSYVAASEQEKPENNHLVVFDRPVKIDDVVHIRNMGAFDSEIKCEEKVDKLQSLYQKNGIVIDKSDKSTDYYLCVFAKECTPSNIKTFEQLISHDTAKSLNIYPFPGSFLKLESGLSFKQNVDLTNLISQKTTFKIKVHQLADKDLKKTSSWNKKLLLPGLCIAAALCYFIWIYKYGANQWLLLYNK